MFIEYNTVRYKKQPIEGQEKLSVILVYMKQYTTQIVHGKLFGISQPKANLWIHYLLPILSSALNEMEAMPCRNMDDLQEEEASIYSHDGTERPIQRPKDNKKQKKYYSGKKKAHTRHYIGFR
ncbi:MAG: transposase family protein [Candidatus Electrothrix gigas]